MMYKFKSKATGDLIMLGPNGDQLLRLLGREPAAKGIIEPAAMPEAMRMLQAAVAQAESARGGSDSGSHSDGSDADQDGGAAERSVGLRQRVWPMVEMLRRAEQAGQPIVWGV